jgi:glycosyltransferase involved in cell wall biosynthesis
VAVISIIVPVYKTEKFLRRCIDSVLAQAFSDFECILVDDGSPDGCPAICDEYAEADRRVRVIHQENAGTARARDAGVKASAGKYLVFVDSDDFIPPEPVRLLYEKAHESGADIVCGAIRFLFKKREVVYMDVLDFSNPLEHIFQSLNNGVCGKIYRREIYPGGLYIPGSNYGEDLIINAQIFSRATREKIAFTDSVVYTYDRRTAGITTRTETFKELSWLEYPPAVCYLWMYDYLNENKLLEGRLKDVFLRRMVKDAILSYICVKGKVSKDEIDMFYNEYFGPCRAKYETRCPEGIIIPLHIISPGLGRFYVRIFNYLKHIRLKLKGMY